MKILKKLCVGVLCCGLFLCGSGFNNKYEDVQTIELKSNPSTGWGWEAQVREYKEPENGEGCSGCKSNRGKVEITHTFEPDSQDEAICGAGGTDIFEIKGVEEGTVHLEFLFVKNDGGLKRVDANKTIWATFGINESKQIKIISFHNSDWCCVRRK